MEYTALHDVNHCQRNWDYSNPIPLEDIQQIVDATLSMPTKQNLLCYKLVASANPSINNKIYRKAFDVVEHEDGEVDDNTGRNTQVDAPLLLCFLELRDYKKLHETHINVGIAAGGAALKAHELGYKTGFAICHSRSDQVQILGEDPERYRFGLTLGIGHPDPNADSHLVLGSRDPVGWATIPEVLRSMTPQREVNIILE